jgi:hypothetical protein
MMDDVFFYHEKTFFVLSIECVGMCWRVVDGTRSFLVRGE